MHKRTLLYLIYHLVGIMLVLDALITTYFIIFNPFEIRVPILLILSVFVSLYCLFSYYKLYRDVAPIIPFFVSKIPAFMFGILLTKTIQWQPFVILCALDIIVLIVAIIKGILFPFVREEKEDAEI